MIKVWEYNFFIGGFLGYEKDLGRGLEIGILTILLPK